MPFDPQTFANSDLLIVGTLVLLEGLLSADNALVLALLVRHLSEKEQQRALSLGLIMAFGLRGVGILLAGFLIKLWWLCGLGAAYLIFLAVKHFASKSHDEDDEDALAAGKKQLSFGRTVALVGFTDVVFAVDSILVAVSLVNRPEKLWIVYLGGLLGMILLRLGAAAFLRLLRKYPALDSTAYGLVAWAGVKLGFSSRHLYGKNNGADYAEMHDLVFWGGFALIIVLGATWAVRSARSHTLTPGEELTDDCIERMEKVIEERKVI
ncbi:TerC family protein [Armatimonas rosea]|uniref:YkoY family integral membrane protein n=1 Tax=Armatimonas rosea TaxID=685828 RepID=A0A7W9W5N2_ARMRO|nr:tellurium resistance protein TerC [Armatimonas rosea]MBB6050644.1 YkoY family integral membrane protein [Armatimonas rosea]